uniref:Uncharacterized protein n=1 Tax=Prolemur simus TaxID=1328070 RepID=A0A8C8YPJ8_PROSS
MTTLQAFTCDVLFPFSNINLDPLTQTYEIPFYLQTSPTGQSTSSLQRPLVPCGESMGSIMGKAEGSVVREEWYAHITALFVAPQFPCLELAAEFMNVDLASTTFQV